MIHSFLMDSRMLFCFGIWSFIKMGVEVATFSINPEIHGQKVKAARERLKATQNMSREMTEEGSRASQANL